MIRFDNVCVTYKQKQGELQAVRKVSLEIQKGCIYGFVGASGAGKSTLLRTVNLLERPTSGEIYVYNQPISGLRGSELRTYRRQVGMIFQHFNLAANKTVGNNIAFSLKAAGIPAEEVRRRVDELLQLVGLSDKRDVYPSRLSGGQKQRVGIARALANNAEILLCDEATSALDPETTASILKLLKDINQKYGITILIITHEIDVVKAICDEVAVMNGGCVVESGRVMDVISSPQNDFTKKLIEHTRSFELPKDITERFSAGKLLEITYLGDEATESVLAGAIRAFKVDISILHGKIDYISETPLGILVVSITGEEIEAAIAFIRSRTLRVQER